MKYALLLAGLLFSACMTEPEVVNTVESKTDTVIVIEKIVKTDTIRIIDTVYVEKEPESPAEEDATLFGFWSGVVGGKEVELAFAKPNIFDFEFTGSIGTSNVEGRATSYKDGMATVSWDIYSSTWQITITGKSMKIREVGDKLFPSSDVQLTKD